jgi:hypothetical protein
MAEGRYNAYYQSFDNATSEGKVLDDDWSGDWESNTPPTRKLTDSESDKRSAYSITIATLLAEYRKKPPPEVTSLEEVLCQRIVAPCLISSKATEAVCTRSRHAESRALRKYPPEIHQWVQFACDVTEYEASTEPVLDSDRYNSIFWSSLSLAENRQLRDESSEQWNLFNNLQCLVKCGIVGEVSDGKDGCTGLVDFALRKAYSLGCDILPGKDPS